MAKAQSGEVQILDRRTGSGDSAATKAKPAARPRRHDPSSTMTNIGAATPSAQARRRPSGPQGGEGRAAGRGRSRTSACR